jgi:hypothetical protein
MLLLGWVSTHSLDMGQPESGWHSGLLAARSGYGQLLVTFEIL